MIKFSDSDYLNVIQEQYTYFDKKSKEQATGRVKPKYKVCGKSILGISPFFITTSNKESCPKRFSVSIKERDWENRLDGFLDGTSFLSPSHIEALNDDEILSKQKDRDNGFRCVARLPTDKYNDLLSLCTNYHPVSTHHKKSILALILSDENIDKALRDLGLDV